MLPAYIGTAPSRNGRRCIACGRPMWVNARRGSEPAGLVAGGGEACLRVSKPRPSAVSGRPLSIALVIALAISATVLRALSGRSSPTTKLPSTCARGT